MSTHSCTRASVCTALCLFTPLCARVSIPWYVFTGRAVLNAPCPVFMSDNSHDHPTARMLFVPFSRFKKQSLEMSHNLSRVASEKVTKQEFKLVYPTLKEGHERFIDTEMSQGLETVGSCAVER